MVSNAHPYPVAECLTLFPGWMRINLKQPLQLLALLWGRTDAHATRDPCGDLAVEDMPVVDVVSVIVGSRDRRKVHRAKWGGEAGVCCGHVVVVVLWV